MTDTFDIDAQSASAAQIAESQFSKEWDQAQARYRAGVNAGYSEDDADKMYLEPIRNKWSILKDVPNEMKASASTELDKANASFLQGIYSGYKPEDAEKIYLRPSEEKWVASADTVPKMKAASEQALRLYYEKSPAMKAEESSAFNELEQGAPVEQVRYNHPLLLTAPGFGTRWNAIFNSTEREQRADERDAAKEEAEKEKASNPIGQVKTYFATAKTTGQPIDPNVATAAKSILGDIAGNITNAVPKVSFAPKYLTKYRTVQDVQAAYRSKELSRDEAKKILQDQFGIQ